VKRYLKIPGALVGFRFVWRLPERQRYWGNSQRPHFRVDQPLVARRDPPFPIPARGAKHDLYKAKTPPSAATTWPHFSPLTGRLQVRDPN